jgi:type IV secretion system protein TrbC
MISIRFHLPRCAASVSAIASLAATTIPAYAAGSNMPWEQPLNQILQSIEGPVSKIMAVIIIITTGLTLAFGDFGDLAISAIPVTIEIVSAHCQISSGRLQ